MPTQWSSKEFEPQYVFSETNRLLFAVPCLRHCMMMRSHYRGPATSVIVYGDPVDAENYAEATRISGFKTHKVTSEYDLVERVRADRKNILMCIILKNEISRKTELALLFAHLYSFPMQTLRTYRAVPDDQLENLNPGALYYWTKPLADTRRAWREAYQTSKMFAIHNEFADTVNKFPKDLLDRLMSNQPAG